MGTLRRLLPVGPDAVLVTSPSHCVWVISYFHIEDPPHVMCSWNIAQHDLDVKIRKIEEFLSKDKLVAVSTTYDHKPNKWQQQYPKAVEVSPLQATTAHTPNTGARDQGNFKPAVVLLFFQALCD